MNRSLDSGRRELRNPVTGHSVIFRRTGTETDGEVLELESRWAPGETAPPDHLHPRQMEHLEMLQGNLLVKVEGSVRELHPGDTLDIPPGTPHAMWNPGPGEARALWETRPALRTESFLKAVWRLAEDGQVNRFGNPRLLPGAVLARAYAAEFRLAHPPRVLQWIAYAVLAPVGRIRGHRPAYDKRRPAPH